MSDVTISCRGLTKSYGQDEARIDAVKSIDLDVEEGVLTLLVGPSGSGKTTLLSIISTILTPDKGELFLLGQKINGMNENEKSKFVQNNLGIVFQSLYLIPTLTVGENVSLPLYIAGLNPEKASVKSREILEKLKLDHRFNSSPYELSKGQQQRVAIARAVVNDAKIIICDEPTSALDHVAGMDVMAILHDLAKKNFKTVLVVTHDHRIFSYADRIINMSDGSIIGEENA
jgi:putative ABC transport system ATP-binding protein